jgi:hypothetical protein
LYQNQGEIATEKTAANDLAAINRPLEDPVLSKWLCQFHR